jgi:hypothetical protein
MTAGQAGSKTCASGSRFDRPATSATGSETGCTNHRLGLLDFGTAIAIDTPRIVETVGKPRDARGALKSNTCRVWNTDNLP